ncbi:hypothetical protein AAY473_030368 [Plecturocebus cupreus]
MVKPVSTKNTKISRAWWCTPVVPATHEAEAGESFEPGRRRLQHNCVPREKAEVTLKAAVKGPRCSNRIEPRTDPGRALEVLRKKTSQLPSSPKPFGRRPRDLQKVLTNGDPVYSQFHDQRCRALLVSRLSLLQAGFAAFPGPGLCGGRQGSPHCVRSAGPDAWACLDASVTRSPRLECSGVITTPRSLEPLGSKTGSYYIAHTGLRLLDSSNPPVLLSESTVITDALLVDEKGDRMGTPESRGVTDSQPRSTFGASTADSTGQQVPEDDRHRNRRTMCCALCNFLDIFQITTDFLLSKKV